MILAEVFNKHICFEKVPWILIMTVFIYDFIFILLI